MEELTPLQRFGDVRSLNEGVGRVPMTMSIGTIDSNENFHP